MRLSMRYLSNKFTDKIRIFQKFRTIRSLNKVLRPRNISGKSRTKIKVEMKRANRRIRENARIFLSAVILDVRFSFFSYVKENVRMYYFHRRYCAEMWREG